MSLSLSISCGDDKKISTQGRGLKQAERLIALAKFSATFDIHQIHRRSTILFHGEKHLSSALLLHLFQKDLAENSHRNSGVKQPQERKIVVSSLSSGVQESSEGYCYSAVFVKWIKNFEVDLGS